MEAADVAHARAAHIAEFEAIKAERAQIAATASVPYFNPVAVAQADVPQIPTHQNVCIYFIIFTF